MKINVEPAPGTAIIKPEPWRNLKTDAGLYIPDKAAERYLQNVGVIVAMGAPFGDNPPCKFAVGDLVVVGKFMEFSPRGIPDDSETLYVADQSHIVCRIDRKARTEEDVETDRKEIDRRVREQYEEAARNAPEMRIGRLVDAVGLPVGSR